MGTRNSAASAFLILVLPISFNTAIAQTASTRFVSKAEIVYDSKTDLTWQRCSVGQRWSGTGCFGTPKAFTFEEAQKQPNGLWRLPTADELTSLIDRERKEQKKKPVVDVAAFPDMDSALMWYWTSSARDGTYAWAVHLGVGYTDHFNRSVANAVRLVRDGS